MATTGFIRPTANNDDDATYSGWTTPDNVHDDNASTAAAFGVSTAKSYYFWTGFDFATAGLESADTVTNVQVRIRGYDANSDGGGWNLGVWWSTSTSNVVDTVKAEHTITLVPTSGTVWGASGSPSTYTVSVASTQPTATELLNSDFQLLIGQDTIDGFPEDARMEMVALEVTYTAAGGTSTPQGIQGISQGINVQRSTRLGGELEQ